MLENIVNSIRLAMLARIGGFKFFYVGSAPHVYQHLNKMLTALENWPNQWGENGIVWVRAGKLYMPAKSFIENLTPLSLDIESARMIGSEKEVVMAVKLADKLPLELGALIIADSPIMASSVPLLVDGRVYRASPLMDSITFIKLAFGGIEGFAKKLFGVEGGEVLRDPLIASAAIIYGYNYEEFAGSLLEAGIKTANSYTPVTVDTSNTSGVVEEFTGILSMYMDNPPGSGEVKEVVEKLILHNKAYGHREERIMRTYILGEISRVGLGFSRLDNASFNRLAVYLARLLRDRFGIAVSALDLEAFAYGLSAGRRSLSELPGILESTIDTRSKASIILSTGIPVNNVFLHPSGMIAHISEPLYRTVRELEKTSKRRINDVVRGMHAYALHLASNLKSLPESDSASIISALIGDYLVLERQWWELTRGPPELVVRRSIKAKTGIETIVKHPEVLRLPRKNQAWITSIGGVEVVMTTTSEHVYRLLEASGSTLLSAMLGKSPVKTLGLVEGWRKATIRVLKRMAKIARDPRKKPSVDEELIARYDVEVLKRKAVLKELYQFEPYLLAIVEAVTRESFNEEDYKIEGELEGKRSGENALAPL